MAKLTPEACRAARALLRWGVRDLAAAAGISQTTVVQFEAGRPHQTSTPDAIVTAFQRSNVEITNGDGTGARLLLKQPPKSKSARKGQK